MQCNHCGYFLDPLEVSCPRCTVFSQSQSIPSQNTASPIAIRIVQLQDGSSYKVCPACQVAADLRLRQCTLCGFIFPFGASGNSAQLPPQARHIPAVSQDNPVLLSKSKQRMIEALVILAAVIGMFAVAGVCVAILSPRKGGTTNAFENRGGLNLVSRAETQDVDTRLTRSEATTGTDLEISLVWNSTTDLDLEVIDPSGELIWAKHRKSSSGGVFDVDANPTLLTAEGSVIAEQGNNPGPGSVLPLDEALVDTDLKRSNLDTAKQFEYDTDPFSIIRRELLQGKFTRKPVEHIYFSNPPKGIYIAQVSCYSWREPDRNPLPCTLDVRSHGKVIHHVNGTMGPRNYIDNSVKFTEAFKFEVK